jgi:rod shape-determining protein MreC
MSVLFLPLNAVSLLKREAAAFVFYHRNMVLREKLQAKNDLLIKKINDVREVFEENKRLRELLSFKKDTGYKVIAARVIGRDPSNWSSAIIIDRGRSNGIKKGDVSITFLGLVGRVAEVNDTTSKIMLLNDPGLSVSAVIQRSRQEALVCGSMGGSLIMKYLPKDSDIKIQDVVVTSGLTQNYPKGLLIGTVVDIAEEFSSLSSYAVIKPAVRLSDLEEVLVILQ